MTNIHKIELEWIYKIQSTLRSQFFDNFFIGWNYVDTFLFLAILFFCTWFFIDRKIALRLLYIFILSSIFNTFFKELFALERPCQVNPALGVLHFSSYGFPSGAAQTAAIISGVIFIESKNRIYQLTGLLFAIFLCFSRVYLGLHYFSDIIGGIIIGNCLVFVYWKFLMWMKIKEKTALFIFPILVFFICPYKLLSQCFFSFGVVIGFFIGKTKNFEFGKITKGIEIAIATFGSLIFLKWNSDCFSIKLISTFTGGVWLSYLGPFLVHNFTKFSHNKAN